MKKEVTALNNTVEELGDAVTDTVAVTIPVVVQIVNIPWVVVRTFTEETSGLVDGIVGY
jgi:hypothetical protein